MPKFEEFTDVGVHGFLHRATGLAGDGLVLTHGAGGNCGMPLLVAVADEFALSGITVLRCDLPFRQKRASGPPHPGTAAADRAGLKQAVSGLRALVAGRVFLGGQSYGGRQASLLAAEDDDAASGLLLLSYPLHPPGKPEQLRTSHFPSLRIPTVFVQGSRDPFGSLEEIQRAIALMPAPTVLVEIANAGHDLAREKFDIACQLVQPFLGLMQARV